MMRQWLGLIYDEYRKECLGKCAIMGFVKSEVRVMDDMVRTYYV
mgnify:CR=1 FL=1